MALSNGHRLIIQLVVSMFCLVVVGGSFVFPLFSPSLRGAPFAYNEQQISIVSTAAVLGSFFNQPFGILFDKYHARVTIAVGTVIYVGSWVALYCTTFSRGHDIYLQRLQAAAANHSLRGTGSSSLLPAVPGEPSLPSVEFVAALMFVSMSAISALEMGNIMCTLELLSLHMGTATVLAKSMIGLGSSIISLLFAAFASSPKLRESSSSSSGSAVAESISSLLYPFAVNMTEEQLRTEAHLRDVSSFCVFLAVFGGSVGLAAIVVSSKVVNYSSPSSEQQQQQQQINSNVYSNVAIKTPFAGRSAAKKKAKSTSSSMIVGNRNNIASPVSVSEEEAAKAPKPDNAILEEGDDARNGADFTDEDGDDENACSPSSGKNNISSSGSDVILYDPASWKKVSTFWDVRVLGLNVMPCSSSSSLSSDLGNDSSNNPPQLAAHLKVFYLAQYRPLLKRSLFLLMGCIVVVTIASIAELTFPHNDSTPQWVLVAIAVVCGVTPAAFLHLLALLPPSAADAAGGSSMATSLASLTDSITGAVASAPTVPQQNREREENAYDDDRNDNNINININRRHSPSSPVAVASSSAAAAAAAPTPRPPAGRKKALPVASLTMLALTASGGNAAMDSAEAEPVSSPSLPFSPSSKEAAAMTETDAVDGGSVPRRQQQEQESVVVRNGGSSAGAKGEEVAASTTTSNAKALFHSLRERGNDAFRNRDHPTAVELYTQAISALPAAEETKGRDCATVHSNRAAALTELGEMQQARMDSEMAIRADPLWMKGFLRRGTVSHREALDRMRTNKTMARAQPSAAATAVKDDDIQSPATSSSSGQRQETTITIRQLLRDALVDYETALRLEGNRNSDLQERVASIQRLLKGSGASKGDDVDDANSSNNNNEESEQSSSSLIERLIHMIDDAKVHGKSRRLPLIDITDDFLESDEQTFGSEQQMQQSQNYPQQNRESLFDNARRRPLDLLLLLLEFTLLWGGTVLVYNNIASIYRALAGDSFAFSVNRNAVFVSVFGIGNAVGRAWGGLVVGLHNGRAQPLHVLLRTPPIVLMIGMALFLVCRGVGLALPFVLCGLATGFTWSSIVQIVKRNFAFAGSLYSLLYVAGASGTVLFSFLLFPAVVDAHFSSSFAGNASAAATTDTAGTDTTTMSAMMSSTSTTSSVPTTNSNSNSGSGTTATTTNNNNCVGLECVEISMLVGILSCIVAYVLAEIIIWRVDNGAWDSDLGPRLAADEQIVEEELMPQARWEGNEMGGDDASPFSLQRRRQQQQQQYQRQSSMARAPSSVNSNDQFVPNVVVL